VIDVPENPPAPQWATTSGDVWARRWRDTDRGLAGLAPHLLSAIVASAPAGPFRSLEVGCGAGSTAIAVAETCSGAEITACDISPSLVEVARQRTTEMPQIHVLEGDAEVVAASEGPFDLIFSRHGVMFFPDPVRAFRTFRGASTPGASLVFSCFRDWAPNPWGSELASAAAGKVLPAPGREPGAFAFADPDHVLEILGSSGWADAEPRAIDFQYVAAESDDAVDRAVSFFAEIGPASRLVQSLPKGERLAALERMRGVVESHFDGRAVAFPAAAWVWQAKAGSAAS
jgi:SAM-dependent methyltransferase